MGLRTNPSAEFLDAKFGAGMLRQLASWLISLIPRYVSGDVKTVAREPGRRGLAGAESLQLFGLEGS